METKRQEKISKLLQKDLGQIFQTEMPHLAMRSMLTVTKVHISTDLSQAKVYISLFATKNKEAIIANIRKHTSEIRRELGNRIRHQVRVIPSLNFYLDDSLDYIEKIDTLLKD
jgi:ribosome-binding factor A